MKLTPQERQAIVKDLVTNCDCWKHQGDANVLNNFSDEKLVQLKEHADKEKQAIQVANAAVNGFSDGDTAYRINPETGKWERRQVANAKKKADPPEDDEEDDDDEDDYVPPKKKGMKANAEDDDEEHVRVRPRTADEWVRTAPPEVQTAFRNAEAIVNRDKDIIISKLLANVAESERQVHRERLQRRTLDDLHYDLSLLPKAPTQDDIDRVAGVNNRRSKPQRAGDEDMLMSPVMNWETVGDEAGKGGTQVAANADTREEDEGPSDEEWLQNAPPRIRQVVQNASVVEARERRGLIDTLTANFQGDEDQEKRLVQRLNSKSVEELRDLLALSPKPQVRPSNFFGASTPLANSRPANVNEDVLMPPVMDWKTAAN